MGIKEEGTSHLTSAIFTNKKFIALQKKFTDKLRKNHVY